MHGYTAVSDLEEYVSSIDSWCIAGPDSCNKFQFYCDGRCFDIKIRCNGEYDCYDGLDEMNCEQGMLFFLSFFLSFFLFFLSF